MSADARIVETVPLPIITDQLYDTKELTIEANESDIAMLEQDSMF